MMRLFSLCTFLVLALGVLPAAAHPLTQVEDALRASNPGVRFIDAPAPRFALQDMSGESVSLGSLQGQVVVLNFVEVHCGETCTRHMSWLARIQDMVNITPMQEQVDFVTIAMTEGALATDEAIRLFAKRHSLDDSNWNVLYQMDDDRTGDIQEIAHAYGIQPGSEAGEVTTLVLDQTGQVRARFQGLDFERMDLITYVNALIEDDHSK